MKKQRENCSDLYRLYGDKLWTGVSFCPGIDFIKIQNEKLIWFNYRQCLFKKARKCMRIVAYDLKMQKKKDNLIYSGHALGYTSNKLS